MSIPILLEMMRRRNTAIREREMNWFRALLSVATMLASHAFAKHHVPTPSRFTRVQRRFGAAVQSAPSRSPAHHKLPQEEVIELSPACAAALKSIE